MRSRKLLPYLRAVAWRLPDKFALPTTGKNSTLFVWLATSNRVVCSSPCGRISLTYWQLGKTKVNDELIPILLKDTSADRVNRADEQRDR
jgi:hypothetical protein